MPLSLFEVPDALKRCRTKRKNRINKRPKGCSIEKCPEKATKRIVAEHWEADTVGLRKGKEAVVLTLVEREANRCISIGISGRTSPAVLAAMQALYARLGKQFSKVVKTITTDNGLEFEDLAQLEKLGATVSFAHPYSSWKRPVNEQHKGISGPSFQGRPT